MKSVIVGTAGHIDHGKTALVKALTGIDADRLEEEKRRGITIDIGFAHLDLDAPGGETVHLGFVDVPGHERFVRNMLAGIGGIDMVLLVIAADEGIMPQTREHFDICRLLSVQRGITVLTKSDAVDSDTLEVVRLEVEEFLRGSFLDPVRAPILAVSSLTGEGLGELIHAIAKVAAEAVVRDSTALPRLPIDRVFTMKGFGTVVTGTLVSGTVNREDEMEVFPQGRRVRVRGVQVHGSAAEQAIAGQRTALNLAGVATGDLARGMTLAPPDTLRATRRADVFLRVLPSARPLKDRARVHFHAFTTETLAEVVLIGEKTVAPGGAGYAQLRLADPTLLLPGDHFILRQFSPVVTIGGGVVIDAAPIPRRRQPAATLEFLRSIETGPDEEVLLARIERRGNQALNINDAIAETGWPKHRMAGPLQVLLDRHQIFRAGEEFIAASHFDAAKQAALAEVTAYHNANPLVAGFGKEALREKVGLGEAVFSAVMASLVAEKKLDIAGEVVRLPGRGVRLKDEESESKQVIETAFASAGLKVPALKDVLAGLKIDRVRSQKIVTLLLRDRVLVKISEDLVFHHSALENLKRAVIALKPNTPKIDVARFKDLTGVSRKYAIPLLEYLDRERVTLRVGNERAIL